jgi:hypothetical protein
MGAYGEGRIARGWRLLGQSWDFLRERPRLMVLPLISAIIGLTIYAAIGLPVYEALGGVDDRARIFLAFAAATWPASFVATFFGVAFLAMVMDDLEGHTPRIAAGLEFARGRWRAILAWSLLSSGVGLVLGALQQIPHIGGWLGRLLGFAGGLAWNLASFFVLPVMVLHGTGPIESLKRSARVFQRRWGEAVTADVGLGAITMLVIMPASILVGLGIAVYEDGSNPIGVVLILIGGVSAFWLMTMVGVVGQLFRLAAYRETTEGILDGPFDADDIAGGVKPRRRLFRRGA